MNNDLIKDHVIDYARLITLLCYQGLSAKAAAKEMDLTHKDVETALAKPTVQKMVVDAQKSRHKLIAHIPIANYANRLKKLDNLYNAAYASGEHDVCLKALASARDETKTIIAVNNEEKVASPSITVNIEKYAVNESEWIEENDSKGELTNLVKIRKIDPVDVLASPTETSTTKDYKPVTRVVH